MRVLFVKDTLGHAGKDISGGVVYLLETLPRLEKPIVPSLCVLRSHHPMAARFEAFGIRPIFLARAKWDPRVLTDLLGLLKREDIDLLHIEGRKSLLFGRLAARLAGRPVVAHFHDMLPLGAGMRALQRRLAPATELGLTVSGAVRDFVVREFALPAERVEVLHNGHDLDRYATPSADARRLRERLGLSETAPLVGLIARIVNPIKGQDLMIGAMPRLLEKHPDAVLLVVGDGPDRAACEALARRLEVERAVQFLGQRDDVPDLLAMVDVVVMPSLSEGFGYAALEAAAAGRPVVAFRTGGIPEIVVDGISGLLVATAEVRDLADALARVLGDGDLAAKLGRGGRRRAGHFTLERHAQRLAEIYAAVSGPDPAGRADPKGEDLGPMGAIDRDTEDVRG